MFVGRVGRKRLPHDNPDWTVSHDDQNFNDKMLLKIWNVNDAVKFIFNRKSLKALN